MGVCQSRSDGKKSQRQKQLQIVSEQTVQERPKSKTNGLRHKTMPSIHCISKDKLISCKSINISKIKKRVCGESLARFYTVLNSQFVYQNNDNMRLVQHNVTGVVRVARNIQKPVELDQNFDTFVANLQEQTYSSPHLANIIELYQDSKSYYAVQEYCSGGLLLDKCGQVKEEEAIYIISQILDILQEIHKQGNSHGSLSISSFALYDQTNNHYVKLIDIIPIFQVKEKSKINEMQKNDRQAVGLILFQLITNKQITSQTIEMIIKIPKDLPTKTEWYHLVLLLLESRSFIIYEQVLLNKQYKEIVQKQEARYTETIINKSVKKTSYIQQKILIIMNFIFFKERQSQLEIIFKKNDDNRNGTLSKQELQIALGIEDDIDDLFENIDCDGNGEIDLDEFILHSCDRQALITDFNLDATFKEISKRGYIIASNFSTLKNCDEEKIEDDIIKFCNCKRMSLEQFKKLMMDLL
ncbi:unnamed protein product [Paramecium pentaurelia]|uniref:EF-hand domain-containing protein n=1 Tax=Paramecium pentaurelia TaxID=43138 RepID=A0A8S1WZX9_9CILI|nr:unnamed protein product [Paramecium pentaurelia]